MRKREIERDGIWGKDWMAEWSTERHSQWKRDKNQRMNRMKDRKIEICFQIRWGRTNWCFCGAEECNLCKSLVIAYIWLADYLLPEQLLFWVSWPRPFIDECHVQNPLILILSIVNSALSFIRSVVHSYSNSYATNWNRWILRWTNIQP